MPDENGRRPSRTGDQVKEPKKSISETTLQIHEYSTGRDRARQDTQDEIATTYRRALEPEIRGVKVGQKGKSDRWLTIDGDESIRGRKPTVDRGGCGYVIRSWCNGFLRNLKN